MAGTLQLVADVGGTKTLFALAGPTGLSDVVRRENDTASSFDEALDDYLAALPTELCGTLAGACIAAAGPVSGDRVLLTNRSGWEIAGPRIESTLAGAPVRLVNDFAAAAEGLAALTSADLHTLQTGSVRREAVRLCVGPGTGFGVAAVHRGQVLHSEGGHAAFAPVDQAQVELWRFFGGEYHRVTVEHVCSGPGLVGTYRHCLHRAGHAIDGDISPARVLARARREGEADARHAVDLFLKVLGGVTGDLALTFLALGGIYLTGGIALHLLPELSQGGFLRAFNRKAEQAGLTRQMPVHVVLRDDLALLGAARLAQQAHDASGP